MSELSTKLEDLRNVLITNILDKDITCTTSDSINELIEKVNTIKTPISTSLTMADSYADNVTGLITCLRDKLRINLSKQGVTTSDNDGLTTLANDISSIKFTTSLNLTSNTTSVSVGGKFTLTATLTDERNKAVSNATIVFKEGTTTLTTATTNSSGVATYSYTPSTAGTKSVSATFGGINDLISSTSANVSLTVTKLGSSVSLSLSSNSVVRGNGINISVSGKGQINIGTSYGSNNIGTVTSSGTVSYVPSNSCTIYAVSYGDTNYNGSSTSAGLTVTEPYVYHNTSLSITGSTSVTSGVTNSYIINKGTMPSDATVKYYLGGSQLGSTTGNSFSCSMGAGSHTLKVVYDGQTVGYDVYYGSNATLGVTATNPDVQSTASINASTTNVMWGAGITLTANTNVPSRTIKIHYGSQYSSVTTNSSGQASISVSFDSPQTVSAWVEISGLSGYTNCNSESVSITVRKRTTKIGNMLTQLAKGQSWTCLLLDETNSNVVGRKVHITNKLYGTTNTSDLGYNTTDTNGQCQTVAINYDLKNVYIGFYPTFDGDSYYEGCTDGVWCNYNSAGA